MEDEQDTSVPSFDLLPHRENSFSDTAECHHKNEEVVSSRASILKKSKSSEPKTSKQQLNISPGKFFDNSTKRERVETECNSSPTVPPHNLNDVKNNHVEDYSEENPVYSEATAQEPNSTASINGEKESTQEEIVENSLIVKPAEVKVPLIVHHLMREDVFVDIVSNINGFLHRAIDKMWYRKWATSITYLSFLPSSTPFCRDSDSLSVDSSDDSSDEGYEIIKEISSSQQSSGTAGRLCL